MGMLDRTVWLQAADAADAGHAGHAGCGQCVSAASGPVCVGTYGAPCPEPLLRGDAPALARALQVLRAVADGEGNLVDTHRFSALRIEGGEAELTLTFARGCSPSRLLAEDAFQVLRRALPDTDVYVKLAG
jgi:hypothetical protein